MSQLWKRTDCPACVRDDRTRRVGAEMECPGHPDPSGTIAWADETHEHTGGQYAKGGLVEGPPDSTKLLVEIQGGGPPLLTAADIRRLGLPDVFRRLNEQPPR